MSPETLSTIVNIISLVASIASLVLAIVAIKLSRWFYDMSKSTTEKTMESSLKISASVDRVEALFGSMYSDTFGLVRDSYSGMLKQMAIGGSVADDGGNQEVEEMVSNQITELTKSFDNRLDAVLSKLDLTTTQMDELRNEVKPLVSDVIVETREVEEQVQRQRVRNWLDKVCGVDGVGRSSGSYLTSIVKSLGTTEYLLLSELSAMESEGLCEYALINCDKGIVLSVAKPPFKLNPPKNT